MAAICYTKRMHEIDFPPIPPPPPMTAEQREMAEASIRAAIAREAERNAQIMGAEVCCADEPALSYDKATPGDSCAGEICIPMASMPGECATGVPRKTLGKRQSALFARRKKATLPAIDLPENKPRKPNLQAVNLSFAARVIIWVRDRYDNNAPAIYKAAYLSRKTYSWQFGLSPQFRILIRCGSFAASAERLTAVPVVRRRITLSGLLMTPQSIA